MDNFGLAFILCGGNSKRMGFDKCNIKVKDKFLIEIIGEQLEKVFKEVILLSNYSNKFRHFKYKALEDMVPNIGPMGAIYTALKHSASKYIFVMACDMPVVNIDYIKYMMKIIEEEGVDGVVAYRGNYVEPLYAFYSKSMINTFEKQIEKNSFKLLEVINNSKIHFIQESKVKEYCISKDIFTNLNYKEDLKVLDEFFNNV